MPRRMWIRPARMAPPKCAAAMVRRVSSGRSRKACSAAAKAVNPRHPNRVWKRHARLNRRHRNLAPPNRVWRNPYGFLSLRRRVLNLHR